MEKIKSLTIANISEAHNLLLQLLNSGSNLHVDLSGLEEIDITGIQLLISFSKEVSILKKEVDYRGEFKESFTNSLNGIIFHPTPLVNGAQFSTYISDIVRSSL